MFRGLIVSLGRGFLDPFSGTLRPLPRVDGEISTAKLFLTVRGLLLQPFGLLMRGDLAPLGVGGPTLRLMN